jgi:dipeptidyl-peptidase 4
MRPNRFAFLSPLAVLLIASSLVAQDRLLTVDDIYDPEKRVNFTGAPVMSVVWLADGKSYLQRKTDPATRRTQLMKVDALTGRAAPFYDAAKMEAAFARLPGFAAEAARQIARSPFDLNPQQSAALVNHANDLFYYEFGSDTAVRLTDSAEEEVGEEFSPDGRMVSYVRDYNIHVVDVATQKGWSLTKGGHAKLLNGRLDWVYQEELYGRGNFKGYWWSPDSKQIVYLQLDESPVKDFVVVNHLPYQQDVEVTPYPKAGMPNPNVRIAAVSAAGGESRFADIFKYQGSEPLVVRVGWKPDSSKFYFLIQNREQTWLDLCFADPRTGKVETAFRETSPAWVEVDRTGLVAWLKDGSFLWTSERSGFQHLYHYSPDCKQVRPVTSGKWEAREFHGVDEAAGHVYFSGTERSPVGLDAYRVKLDGTGLKRLTETPGTHTVNFNPTLTHFVDVWSDVETPSQTRLFKSDGAPARVIEENRVEALKQYKLGRPEFLQVRTRDGFVMEAMMIKPPDFDPAKKYPVMSYNYSGPHAQSVKNAWGGATYLWHQMLAQQGYIIWVCDNRSASGKGAESVYPVYKNLGPLELRDLEDGVAHLKSLPYVDGTRVGLWGWSYGGFMTAYALTHSNVFKLGIVGAPVTDWRLYDTIYTERYMATPQNNPEGYARTSVVAAAKNLSGKMLLIHGTIDDNVHMQNSIQFIYELQRAGKQFEFMAYPQSRHGVTDPQLLKHMREMMTKFILENL